MFGHTGYLINLAAPPSPNRDKSVQSLIQEVEFAMALNLPFLVLHPGAHLRAGEQAGLDRAIQGLDEVNWFNVEPSDMLEIGDNLKALGSKLK